MYRCEQCSKVSRTEQPAIYKVTETRAVTYPYRKDGQRRYGRCSNPPPDDPEKRCRDDHGGTGTEIVSQILICRNCNEEDKKTV